MAQPEARPEEGTEDQGDSRKAFKDLEMVTDKEEGDLPEEITVGSLGCLTFLCKQNKTYR